MVAVGRYVIMSSIKDAFLFAAALGACRGSERDHVLASGRFFAAAPGANLYWNRTY